MKCNCDYQITKTGYIQTYHVYGRCPVHSPRLIRRGPLKRDESPELPHPAPEEY